MQMAIKILQIDLQNDITPQIGSYDNAGGVTPNNWLNEDGVHSLGPTNGQGTTPYYWFTSTREVTDFDLCWEDYQDHLQTTTQYHLEIGDSTGNVVLSAFRRHSSYSIGPVQVGNLAYQTWHKILVEVRKASASSSTVTVYVNGKKVATGTSNTLLTSAKIALLGHVPDSYYWQNAGQRLRYVTIYDRSYTSKGINLDGMMTTITALISKLIAKLSTVALTGSYNDLSDKPTISTVNDGTLTIQQNGTNVATFTANASTNATANITVPTKTSDLTNDSGFITEDTTKIPLAGSNQISGSLIPSTDGTVNLGSASYQWNNLYAKNYYYKGVAWGLDKANVWSAHQKIVGSNSRGIVSIYNPTYTKGSELSVTDFSLGTIFMGDGGQTGLANSLGFISTDLASSGAITQLSLSAIENTASSSARTNVVLLYDKNDSENPRKVTIQGSIFPHANATYSLGASTIKWKSFNGINPGALSLPGVSYINLDTTNFDATSTTIGTFTPTVDGWAILSISQKNKHFGIWMVSGAYRATFHSVYHNSDYLIFALMPVRANVTMNIYCTADDIDSTRKVDWLRLFACQGNV